MFIRVGPNRAINPEHIVEIRVAEIDEGKISLLMVTGQTIEYPKSQSPDVLEELCGPLPVPEEPEEPEAEPEEEAA